VLQQLITALGWIFALYAAWTTYKDFKIQEKEKRKYCGYE
jgi:uncharacterized membrane protein required for colicin V production